MTSFYKEGTTVIIKSTYFTEKSGLGTNTTMESMVGKKFKIDGAIQSDNCHVCGWNWDKRDLIFPDIKEQEPIIAHFDPENLMDT